MLRCIICDEDKPADRLPDGQRCFGCIAAGRPLPGAPPPPSRLIDPAETEVRPVLNVVREVFCTTDNCDKPGGYRNTVKCQKHYEALLRGARKAKPDGPSGAKKKKRKPVSGPQTRREVAARQVAAAVQRGNGEVVARLDTLLAYDRKSEVLADGMRIAAERGWVVPDGQGYVAGPVEPGPEPSPKAPAGPKRTAAAKGAERAALERQRRQAEAEALADRIVAHGPAKASAMAAALGVSTQQTRWKQAVRLVRERNIDPFDVKAAGLARLAAGIPDALRGGRKTQAALAAEFGVPPHWIGEAASVLREGGVIESSKALGYWLPADANGSADE